MELSEWLSIARLVIAFLAIGITVGLSIVTAVITLVIKQSRILGRLEQKLEGFDEFLDEVRELMSRFDSTERQAWMTERQLADLGREVDRRCPPVPQASSTKGNGDDDAKRLISES